MLWINQRHGHRRPGHQLGRAAAACHTHLSPPAPAPVASRCLRSRRPGLFERERSALDAALFVSLSELPTAVETVLFLFVNQVHMTVAEAGQISSTEVLCPTVAFLTLTALLKPAYHHRLKFRWLLFAVWLSATPRPDGDEASSSALTQDKVSPYRALQEHSTLRCIFQLEATVLSCWVLWSP